METVLTEKVQATAPVKTFPKKVQNAWAMYDWANSAYNLVITSTIFPAYYVAITTVNGNDQVQFAGRTFKNTALFDYAIATAYLIIAFVSPVLSSIADYKGNKKRFMQLFCYIGALSCCLLYFFKADTLALGIICSSLAALGYCGSLVFYNAYLPEIAPEEQRDKLSAKGFAYGYIGSVILQIICFVFVLMPELFGITDGTFAPRLSFLLVGIWWLLFAQIPFTRLPKGTPLAQHSEHSLLTNGFHELRKVWNQIKDMPVLRMYLFAFFFYSMGVQTVMLAATIFGTKEIKKGDGSAMGTQELIVAILIIQLVAIVGANIIARLAVKYGNLKVLLSVVCIWIGICIAAYYTTLDTEFYMLATAVGLVMGGIQSLSRSTYSKLMPETKDTTSFFSFYDVTEKLAIVCGMFTFGYIDEIMSMRTAIFSLITFFVIGAGILYLAFAKAKKERINSTVI